MSGWERETLIQVILELNSLTSYSYLKRSVKRKNIEGKNLQHHGSMPPTKITAPIVMHFCPAAPKPEATRAFKVASTLASGITTA